MSGSCMRCICLVILSLLQISDSSISEQFGVAAIRIGEFRFVKNVIEKVFVASDGEVKNILKGGIVQAINSDGTCDILIKVC